MNKQGKSPYSKSKNQGTIRIIGGKWRSRKITVAGVEGLRPTTDRVRETVFNWLMPYISGSHCLDVCAGTGVLGFEALSRGAVRVDFVESNATAANMLIENAKALDIDVEVTRQSILDYLKANQSNKSYDIVFVDPPFDLQMHEQIFAELEKGNWLSSKALIYCEKPRLNQIKLPENWFWYKEKRNKNIEFGLLAY